MKTVVQKAIVEIIQPRIVKYTCDLCGRLLGKGNRKQTVYTPDGEKHYCMNTCAWGEAHDHYPVPAQPIQDK